MFFVVVREIEGIRRDCHVFDLIEDAQSYYDQAAYVCMEEPDTTPGGDPTIVTNCWLYSADVLEFNTARDAALSGRAKLIAVCFPPEDA
jgi:hypothetical protein